MKNNPLDRVIAFSQLLLLGVWEALGVIAFDWNPFVIAAVWFVGLWTFNVLAASGINVYIKVTTPTAVIVGADADPVVIDDEDVS